MGPLCYGVRGLLCLQYRRGRNAPLPTDIIIRRRFQCGEFGTLPARKAVPIFRFIKIPTALSLTTARKSTHGLVAWRCLLRANEGKRSRTRIFDVPYHKRDMASGWY